MGEIKSKAIQDLDESETWKIRQRGENVDKLIRRMNTRTEDNPRIISGPAKAQSELKRMLSFGKKSKKKKWRGERCENNNFVAVGEDVKKCEVAECRETEEIVSGEMGNDVIVIDDSGGDCDGDGNIGRKDSIDNIIDLIVSKSIKRDEALSQIIEESERRRALKRSRSYHGKENKKTSMAVSNMREVDVRPEEESLMKRLENLEKRASVFEKGVGKVENWLVRDTGVVRQRSRCSAASEEFDRNMREILEENYKDEEELLNDLKTIERVKPYQWTPKKDKLIAAPKADPIIRNSIEKIVYKDLINGRREVELDIEIEKEVQEIMEEVKENDTKRAAVVTNGNEIPETVNGITESSDGDWVIVEMENPPKKMGNGVVGNGLPKSETPLVSGVIGNGMGTMNGGERIKKDLPRVTGGKTYCQNCKKKCSGEVLRVQDKYFHISCFKCKACKTSLAQGGFFCKDGDYYCTNDYQRQFGTKCSHCGEYVEGEVVTALGNTYHQKCFTCARCRQVFPSGERVTYTGKEVLCQKCVQIPVRDTRSPARSPTGPNECAGCGEELKDGQALIALERQWHIWCFKCKTCDSVLHGEYMGKDGVPYCEKDYQKQFGVKCAYCSRFISGKVLQAGDNHHFHPTCARCSKCGDPFGDGEEMYLQGGAIWHPRCGPGPTENGTVINGSGVLENGHCTDTDGEMSGREGRDFDRMSSSAVSEMQFSLRSRTPSLNGSLGSPCNSLNRKYAYHRAGSPGIILREYKSSQQFPEDISRIYTYSYLTEEPSQGYLKRPIDPYDKPPTSPHFHRPSSSHSQRSGKILIKTGSRSGMKVMAESIRSETPRPKSPHMNNEEPIELAHFPDAKKPNPGEKPKIERDDFPAPPYPYTDPERRKRWSDSYKGLSDEEQDETDAKDKSESGGDDKLKKEEEELSKIATGIGKVFLQNVKEREKLRQWKLQHLDPRNASRVPSANKEPAYRLRYQSPVNASPSRNMDHPRPWEEDEYMDRSSSYRSSVGRSVGAIPSYNATSSSRLGYVRSPGKASTLPTGRYTSGYCSDYGVGYNGDFSYSGGFGEKTHSTEFSSGKSDISGGSISEVDRRGLNADMPMSTTFQGGLRYSSYSPHLRRSLPTLSHMSNEPPKIYPYHLLVITNYRLPADVDRCNLERHLSESEFEQRFQCTRTEFYRLPQWRRNDLKRRLKLF